ncbi:DUF6461 domain-containing protein [Pseudonocardia sp. CA-142604]|uniref:DUF6461 domain-containing protein n=1 Tax=Pseudonocardia sp. CA-142604 TaxID=3240024 RepID=UPI003D949A58
MARAAEPMRAPVAAAWPVGAPGAETTVPEPPDGVADALVEIVLSALPMVAGRIPATPVALLGRLAAPAAPADALRPAHGRRSGVDHLLAERLLGALELTVPDVALDIPETLRGPARARVSQGRGGVASMSASGDSEAYSAVTLLDQIAPGLRELVAGLVGALAEHERIAPLLEIPPGAEQDVAAAHGGIHLALAVVTALAVLRAAAPPILGAEPPVVVGVALDAATRVLLSRPMPVEYAAALRERLRAEYVLPRFSAGDVPVLEHRFAMVEGAFPAVAGEPANGLVQAVPGGIVLRTGVSSAAVPVWLRVLAEEPTVVDLASWQEVVDISYTAEEGAASLLGPAAPAPSHLLGQTPPWPGPVRARISARGRDEHGDGGERYEIVVWPAPLAGEVVHKATDRLGHRLRGEPEPPVVARPEVAYRWVRGTGLGPAGTVMVVTGAEPEQVLAAFGADPAQPVPLTELFGQIGIDPWVAVLPIDGAVLALEYNGWQGAQGPVLRRASAHGSAASMYWNVNALTSLSFAREGELLASFEPPPPALPGDPEVLAALAGLELEDYHDRVEKGLVAVERFTGRGVRAEDVALVEAAGIAYRIHGASGSDSAGVLFRAPDRSAGS